MRNKKKTQGIISLTVIAGILTTLFISAIAAPAKETEVVKVGYFTSVPEYQTQSTDGVYSGYGYDYLQKIAEHTNWEYEYIHGTWAECMDRLESGEIDLLGCVSKTPAREERMSFSQFDCGYSTVKLLANISNTSLVEGDWENFNNIAVGMIENSQSNADFSAFADEHAFHFTPSYFSTTADSLSALQSGQIDAIVTSIFSVPSDLRLIYEFEPAPIYYAVSKAKPALLKQLDAAMGQIKMREPNFENHLRQEYFDDTYTESVILTTAEKKYLQDHPTLKIAGDVDWMPIQGYDPNTQKLIGVSGEILDQITQISGLHFTFVPTQTDDDARKLLAKGEIDLMPGYFGTLAEESVDALSYTYMEVPMVFVCRKGFPISVNSRTRVGVVSRSTATTEFLETTYPQYEVVKFVTSKDCLNALKSGQIQLAMRNMYSTQLFLFENSDLMLLGSTGYSMQLRFAFGKDAPPELISIFNKCISSISPDDRHDILLEVTAMGFEQQPVTPLTILIAVGALIFLSIAIYAIHISHRLFQQNTELFAAKKAVEEKMLLEQILEEERTYHEISFGKYDNVLEADLTHNMTVGRNSQLLLQLLHLSHDATFEEFINAASVALVHKDFKESFLNFFNRKKLLSDFHDGQNQRVLELIQSNDGINYHWNRIDITIYYSPAHNTIRMIAYINDIEREKARDTELLLQAQTDPLTGLYNKTTTHQLIEEYLMTDEHRHNCHALMIIDIDNFKLVNDTHGHPIGDMLLSEFAEGLSHLLRASDIIGRIGGDEFLIFLKDIQSHEILSQVAGEILETLRLIGEIVAKGIPVSASIGIACTNEGATTFNELYQRADTALYDVKKSGKNSYALYDGAHNIQELTKLSEIKRSLAMALDMDSNLPGYINCLFAESNNIPHTIDVVLSIIGRNFHVSRIYIFEILTDNQHISNTFEWCAPTIAPQISAMQNLPVCDYTGYFSRFDEYGVLYLSAPETVQEPHLQSILQTRGVKSLLHYSIKWNGESKGFIGFEECVDANRDFCPEDISTLRIITDTISAYLVKHREHHLAVEEMVRLATTDDLTSLYNQKGFEMEAARLLSTLPDDKEIILLAVDVTMFEMFNALHGYEAGDQMLCSIAQVLRNAFPLPNNLCARFFADHFACLITTHNAEEVVSTIQQLHNHEAWTTVQIRFGIYETTNKMIPVSLMCDRAFSANRSVRGNKDAFIGIYNHALHARDLEDAEMLANMPQAMAAGEFVAWYQPKYNLRTQEIVGAEALVRWVRPGQEIIPPNRFISLFESNGSIRELDFYMLEQVCLWLSHVRDAALPIVPVSVNLSRIHVYDDALAKRLTDILAKYNIPTELIEIELTESIFLATTEQLTQAIEKLHQAGFEVSIDDFGSGFSSLNVLKDVAFDVVKLDRSFLSQTSGTERGHIIIKSILQLAKELNLRTVAEGVENTEQLEFLRENGCDLGQGYYYSKPITAYEFEELLRNAPLCCKPLS